MGVRPKLWTFLNLSLYILVNSCAVVRMQEIPWHLQQKRERLKREVLANLDFLIGSVTSQGARGGFNLTSAEQGKTRTRYIRQGHVEEVRSMIEQHRKLKELLKELGEVNWEILKVKPGR